jgi:outer membrane protein TolC
LKGIKMSLIFQIILVFTIIISGPVWAETVVSAQFTQGVEHSIDDLPSLVEEAVEHNPEILSAQAKQEAAQAKIPQAWALKKPWFFYDVMGENLQTRLGPQEQRYGVMQEIPFPGKLPLRSHLAEFTANRIGHEFLHVRQTVRSQVISAYADLLEAQQILAVLHDQHSALEQVAATIRAQYATGKKQATDADLPPLVVPVVVRV